MHKGFHLLMVVLASSCTVNPAARRGELPASKAVVSEMRGEVDYSTGQEFRPLPSKIKLHEGDTIKTGMDGKPDLQVNGRTSNIRLLPDTNVKFEQFRSDPKAV